jgi:hypothetical protein
MLSVIRIGQDSSSFIIKGVSQDPIGRVVGDGVTNPFDMIAELAFPSGPVVLRV